MNFLNTSFLPHIPVLVTTGSPRSESTKSEVFDLKTGKACQNLPPFPIEVFGAVGEIVNGFHLICGGYTVVNGATIIYQSGCYALKGNTWKLIGSMRQPRGYASSLLLDKNTMWIMGGYTDSGRTMTTEYIELDANGAMKQSQGPDLPKASDEHCSLRISNTEVIVMGGQLADKTYIYDLQTGTWNEGPQLNDSGERKWAACGFIPDQVTNSR